MACSLKEFNTSGALDPSLFGILDKVIDSIENLKLDEDEYLSAEDSDSKPADTQVTSHNMGNLNSVYNHTFSYVHEAFQDDSDNQSQPIQLKVIEEINNVRQRRSQTVPKPLLLRKETKEFNVNENENIVKLKKEFERKGDRNISNLESFRKQDIFVKRYMNCNEDILKFTQTLEEFRQIISDIPDHLQQTDTFKNSILSKNIVESQLKHFENKSYNQLSELDNAFAQLTTEMLTFENLKLQLEHDLQRHKNEIFKMQQQQQQHHHHQQQQQMIGLQQFQQLQSPQLQIHTTPQFSSSTPIPSNKPSLPDDFFKLSSLKPSPTPQKLQLPPAELIKYLEDLESKCSTWENSWPKMKILTFKRLANTTVNAISSQDMASLMDKINKLDILLSGKTLTALNQTVKLETQDEVEYCSNLITTKLIKKGEQEVSSNPKAAHPIASVIVCLCSKHPTLAKLLLGSFYRACPIMAPIFPKRGILPDSKDFLLSIGYKVKENKLEDADEFSNRVKGLLRLYTCVMQFPIEGIGSVYSIPSHFHGIDKAWAWVAQILQGPMVPGISEVALHAAFELMGYRMGKVYGSQFGKLVQLTRNEFLPNLKQVSPPEHTPSIARLQKFLDDHKTHIPESDGAFSDGFWMKNVFTI